jgi:hypothetical protein
MTDAMRTVLVWLSVAMGSIGLLLVLAALIMSAFRARLQETTALRVGSVAIVLLAAAMVLGATAWIWPHPPQ